MADASSVAKQLAASLVEAADGRSINKEVVHATERVLLDSLACGLGAAPGKVAKAVIAWAMRVGPGGAGSILGSRQCSSVLGAGFVNSTLIRDLDMNDTYYPKDSSHPSDNIGAVLSVGQAESASAEEVIRAILVGFEVTMRSCEMANKSFQRAAGWDHTTFITIGSAAACAILLRLDAEQVAHAISIAACYPTTGELRVGQISMMKSVSAGLAASRGIEAAYLAKEGASGPAFAFEGRRGVSKLMIGECNWDVLTAPVTQWRLPLTCLKRFPAAYIIHSSIDAALTLRQQFLPEEIEEVRVDAFGWLVEDMVSGMGGTSRYQIDSRETADHSLPYCVAVSLLDGAYNLKQLEERRWESPALKSMIAKVKCFHDKEMDKIFPKDRPGRVTVKLTNGSTLVKEVAYPKGDYREPFSDGELAEKFNELAAGTLPQKKRDRVINVALNFNKSSLKELFEACTPD